jgi:hypothetical protein
MDCSFKYKKIKIKLNIIMNSSCGKAILLGFNYKRTKNRSPLPGIIIDLYRVYRYCINRGYSNIKVFTDYDDDKEDYMQPLLDKNIDESIIDFASTITSIDFSHFSDLLRQEIEGERELFVYYTGHYINQYFVLPNNRELSLNKFNAIFDVLDHTASVFFLVDSCYSETIKTSYRVDIHQKKLTYSLDPMIIPHYRLIIITQKTEKVAMDPNGSVFTKNMITYLYQRHSDGLGALLVSLRFAEPLIYTSIYKQDFLYSWV